MERSEFKMKIILKNGFWYVGYTPPSLGDVLRFLLTFVQRFEFDRGDGKTHRSRLTS